MTYSPLHPAAIKSDLAGDSSVWSALCDTHEDLFELYSPTIAAAGSGEGRLLVQGYSLTASFVTLLRWTMRGNRDNQRLRVYVVYRTTGAAELRCSVGGGTGTLVIAAGSGSWVAGYIDVAPAGSPSAPHYAREVVLEAKDTSGVANSLNIIAVEATFAPSTGSGVLTSGWARAQSAALAAADESIPSERVARLLNGPVQIAHDRPVCVLSALQEAPSPRDWSTSGAGWATATKGFLPPQLDAPGLYAISVYLAGNAPEAALTVNGQTRTYVGAGWHHETDVDLPLPPLTGNSGTQGAEAVWSIRSTDGATARLMAAQVWRWEAP